MNLTLIAGNPPRRQSAARLITKHISTRIPSYLCLYNPIWEVYIMALTIVFDDDDYMRPFYYNGIKTKYMVSKDGRVYNTKTGKYMKTDKVYNTDYLAVRLKQRSIGLNKKYSVHRLVADVFIPNPDNLPEVNHINLNKHDNHLSNLEWIDKSGNSRHAINNNTGAFQRGEHNITAKYSDKAIDDVCRMLADGIKPAIISDKTGVSTAMISMIKIGKVRQHQSSKYKWDKVHRKDMVGDKHPNSTINKDMANTICKYLAMGMQIKDISSKTGVRSSIIFSIKARKSWKSVSKDYVW